MSELEDRLRAELTRRADSAPGGTLLAEQIIAAARTRPQDVSRRRGWPTWTLPLLAAGAVAAIVTGVFVGVAQLRDSAAPDRGQVLNSQSASLPTGSPAPTTGHTQGTSRPSPSNGGSLLRSATTAARGPQVLTNFAVGDVTFYGTANAWAIGTADCLAGPGTCAAMQRTTDGGAHWTSMPTPPAGVTGIRFATPQVGYAYSDSVLAMTTDGGDTWTEQKGTGALALETLDGNVIRVTSTGTGCPGPCGLAVRYAQIGSPDWSSATLHIPATANVAAIDLVRSESDAYLLVKRNPAGGAPSATSTLFASTDDGHTWTDRGEPCPAHGPEAGTEMDSTAISAAPGSVTVLCGYRGQLAHIVATSTDGAKAFRYAKGAVPLDSGDLVAGDPATVLVVGGRRSYVSDTGGNGWSGTTVTGTATFVGFESPTLGRIVTDGGRRIWTTTDGGKSWSAFTFPS